VKRTIATKFKRSFDSLNKAWLNRLTATAIAGLSGSIRPPIGNRVALFLQI
jgi:hypothetical protein